LVVGERIEHKVAQQAGTNPAVYEKTNEWLKSSRCEIRIGIEINFVRKMLIQFSVSPVRS
jgi:hypothetical protein